MGFTNTTDLAARLGVSVSYDSVINTHASQATRDKILSDVGSAALNVLDRNALVSLGFMGNIYPNQRDYDIFVDAQYRPTDEPIYVVNRSLRFNNGGRIRLENGKLEGVYFAGPWSEVEFVGGRTPELDKHVMSAVDLASLYRSSRISSGLAPVSVSGIVGHQNGDGTNNHYLLLIDRRLPIGGVKIYVRDGDVVRKESYEVTPR